MPRLELIDLCKKYKNTDAVRNLSMTIEEGEFLVLVGPSGCGKTTTLRMIAGLEEISSGQILLDGKCINGLSPKERDMAMVFQDYALYPHLTVRDNIAFGLKMRGVGKAERHQKAEEIAEILGIRELLSRKPAALSGGERQRVALGRAIVRRPKIFLFDEPLSNLDAALRVQMRHDLKKLHDELKTTFIYVTHDQIEAMTMATRIAVMNQGVLQQLGTPDEIYKKPSNVFVGSFIGTPKMNFLNGFFALQDGEVKCFIGSFQLDVTPDFGQKILERRCLNKDVLIGVRPDKIRILHDEGLCAKVDYTENIGSERYTYFSFDGSEFLAVTEDSYMTGEDVRLGFEWEDVLVFDAETKETLL